MISVVTIRSQGETHNFDVVWEEDSLPLVRHLVALAQGSGGKVTVEVTVR